MCERAHGGLDNEYLQEVCMCGLRSEYLQVVYMDGNNGGQGVITSCFTTEGFL